MGFINQLTSGGHHPAGSSSFFVIEYTENFNNTGQRCWIRPSQVDLDCFTNKGAQINSVIGDTAINIGTLW